jgi:glucokinase
MSATYTIGIDLGGTKLLAGLFDADFKIVARIKQATASNPEAVFQQIADAVHQLLATAKLGPHQVAAVGLGIPGQVDPRTHRVRYAPNLNWRDLDLGAHLPSTWPFRVFPENDVKVGTWGEFTHGAAVGAQHVLGIFAGTGVGGGLILNGELFHGFNFNAGEIGHTVVHWRQGHTLEGIAGRRSVQRRAVEVIADAPKKVRKEWKNVDTTTLKSSAWADLVAKGDPVATQLIDDAARAIGAAVGSAINLLSPQAIVIGGGLAGALGPTFLERIWEIALRYTLPNAADGIRCVPAQLGDDSGIVGAADLARRRAARVAPS